MSGKTNPERRKRIKELHSKGKSLRQIAEIEGINRKTVWQYINGWIK